MSIKPKDLTNKEVKQNQILYFLDDTEKEIGYGKIYLINPKFIRIKIDSGEIPIGCKAGYFEWPWTKIFWNWKDFCRLIFKYNSNSK